MSFRLSEPDQRAVDLLLDRAEAANKSGGVVYGGDASLSQRAAHLREILQLLDLMSLPEVPPNLAANTLQSIEQATAPNHFTTPVGDVMIESL